MNRNSWTKDERAEHDDICAESWDAAGDTRSRVDAYLAKLRDAEQAHRFFAKDCLNSAVRDGAASQLKSWRKRQSKGTVPVSHDGRVIDKRRVIGTTYIDDHGTPVATQTLFDFWTRDQLEAKAAEYASNIQAYKENLHVVLRLIDLLDMAPGAQTPAEAATQVGVTMEDFLGRAA